MCRRIPVTFVLTATLILAASTLSADGRQAFVVGVGNYDNLPVLKNAPNDALLMADTLKKLGFEIHGGGALIDPNAEQLKRAFLRFSASLAEQTEAVIFFAGHGLQSSGENLLIPSDFEVPTDSSIEGGRAARLQSLNLADIVATLEESQVALSIVLLDCCRDPGPLAAEAGLVPDTGLAEPREAALGKGNELLIGFAAKHGQVALDGIRGNSPFTEALSSRLVIPGVSLRKVFEEVTSSVMEMTNSEQQPFFYGSLTRDFYLAGAPSGREMLVDSIAEGIGAPDTVDELIASLQPGNGHSYVRNMLGKPRELSELRATIQGQSKTITSELYETEIYQLELFFVPPSSTIYTTMTGTAARSDEPALLAFVLRIANNAAPIPIYRGSSANTLFVFGKSSSKELWEHSDPTRRWFNGCARHPGIVSSVYYGRGGHYLDWLVPARANVEGRLLTDTMGEPFRSFGVVFSTEDKDLFEFVASRVAPAF